MITKNINGKEDKRLLNIVKQFTKGILNKSSSSQKCYMVCVPLHSYLLFCGYENQLTEGEVETENIVYGHWWLKLRDGRIIDPTADQLEGVNMPPIYFGELPENYKELKPETTLLIEKLKPVK